MEKNGSKKEEAKYRHPNGSPIEFFTDDLFTFFTMTTCRISDFIMVLKNHKDENLSGVGRILDDLLGHADQELKKKVEFIEEKLGEISIDLATGEIGAPYGSFLGLNFTPKGQGEGKGGAKLTPKSAGEKGE